MYANYITKTWILHYKNMNIFVKIAFDESASIYFRSNTPDDVWLYCQTEREQSFSKSESDGEAPSRDWLVLTEPEHKLIPQNYMLSEHYLREIKSNYWSSRMINVLAIVAHLCISRGPLKMIYGSFLFRINKQHLERWDKLPLIVFKRHTPVLCEWRVHQHRTQGLPTSVIAIADINIGTVIYSYSYNRSLMSVEREGERWKKRERGERGGRLVLRQRNAVQHLTRSAKKAEKCTVCIYVWLYKNK